MKGTHRSILDVVPAVRTLEGAGFEVRRPFPGPRLANLGQFILLDHIGPAVIGPNSPGAPTHPHAGMETLTYFLEGGGMHLDSLGNAGEVGAGGAQWMRAGSGIVHDEGANSRLRRGGGPMHAVQLWLNLPREHKDAAPAYRHFEADDIPVYRPQGSGAEVHLIAGDLDGLRGPLETFATPWVAHIRLEPAASLSLAPAGEVAGCYVLKGSARICSSEPIEAGWLALLDDGLNVSLEAGSAGADLILMAGPPLDHPILRYGPFVASDERAMVAIIERYQRGAFGSIAPRIDD